LRFETVEAADVSRQVFMVKRREKRAESGGREKERRREGEKERRREGEKERRREGERRERGGGGEKERRREGESLCQGYSVLPAKTELCRWSVTGQKNKGNVVYAWEKFVFAVRDG